MAVVSGQVTFGTTGAKTVALGIPTNSLDVLSPLAIGHADPSNQFSRQTVGTGAKDSTNCIAIYNTSGVKVVEAKVTGGWGTANINFNCTISNAGFPFDLIATT